MGNLVMPFLPTRGICLLKNHLTQLFRALRTARPKKTASPLQMMLGICVESKLLQGVLLLMIINHNPKPQMFEIKYLSHTLLMPANWPFPRIWAS